MNFLNLDLSLEQQFNLRKMQDSAQNLNIEQARELLVQATRLIMVKDNVIKQLLSEKISRESEDAFS